jgi:hypothetical protein
LTATEKEDRLMGSESKSYTRVVSTDDGGSAFEDAELRLSEQELADGVPAMLVGALGPANGVGFARFAAFHSEPHPAAGAQWVVVLRGVIEVRVADGTSRQFGPGDLVLATDTTGRGHITRVVGDPPVEALSIPRSRTSDSRERPPGSGKSH